MAMAIAYPYMKNIDSSLSGKSQLSIESIPGEPYQGKGDKSLHLNSLFAFTSLSMKCCVLTLANFRFFWSMLLLLQMRSILLFQIQPKWYQMTQRASQVAQAIMITFLT